ncbi:MAG: endonuclease domain-containing protein [Gammaproteobacteria bacterium]
MQSYPYRFSGAARSLRTNPTDAERLLWRHLRGKQMLGLRFYRQRPMLDYVVDFYCPRARLVIELDGGQHFQPHGLKQDAVRDRRLRNKGLEILRFDDRSVLKEPKSVLETIRLSVLERIPL